MNGFSPSLAITKMQITTLMKMAKTKDADDTWERKRLATRWTRGAHTWLGEELTLRRKTWVVLDKVKHVLTIGASNPTCRHWLTPEKAKHVSTHVRTSSCFIQYHEKLEKPRRPSAGERMNELLGKGRRLKNRKEPDEQEIRKSLSRKSVVKSKTLPHSRWSISIFAKNEALNS